MRDALQGGGDGGDRVGTGLARGWSGGVGLPLHASSSLQGGGGRERKYISQVGTPFLSKARTSSKMEAFTKQYRAAM